MPHYFLPLHMGGVSLFLGNVTLLRMPLSKLFLHAWVLADPSWLSKTDSRFIQVCSFLKVQLKLYLSYKNILPKWGGKKTMGFEVGQTGGAKLLNLS